MGVNTDSNLALCARFPASTGTTMQDAISCLRRSQAMLKLLIADDNVLLAHMLEATRCSERYEVVA